MAVVSSQMRLALGLRPLAALSSCVGVVTTQPSSSATSVTREAEPVLANLALGVRSPDWGLRAWGSVVPSIAVWLSDEVVGPGLDFCVSMLHFQLQPGIARMLHFRRSLVFTARRR